jgi:hypothetical protein
MEGLAEVIPASPYHTVGLAFFFVIYFMQLFIVSRVTPGQRDSLMEAICD